MNDSCSYHPLISKTLTLDLITSEISWHGVLS
jgi:hypothetical protein